MSHSGSPKRGLLVVLKIKSNLGIFGIILFLIPVGHYNFVIFRFPAGWERKKENLISVFLYKKPSSGKFFCEEVVAVLSSSVAGIVFDAEEQAIRQRRKSGTTGKNRAFLTAIFPFLYRMGCMETKEGQILPFNASILFFYEFVKVRKRIVTCSYRFVTGKEKSASLRLYYK